MKRFVLCAAILFCAAVSAKAPKTIACDGFYGGHLQGVASDDRHIYWSFTVAIVKTDETGRILASCAAPNHQGDLCYHAGKLYVAVNRGRFNTHGKAVSQVTVYDAQTLKPLKTVPLADVPHGAGGITHKDGRFFVVGGLPLGHERNYVYEYTEDFVFVKRHDLPSGYTWMGIQTAHYEKGTFYFGIYGKAGNPAGVLACKDDFSGLERYTGRGCVGILTYAGAFYTGSTAMDKNKRGLTGRIVREEAFPDAARRYALVPSGKGALRLFFAQRDAGMWRDGGYVFDVDANKPIFSVDGLFTPRLKVSSLDPLPGVVLDDKKGAWALELVRAVRRAAARDEVFALVFPGTRETAEAQPALKGLLDAACSEATRLGLEIVGR